MRIGFISDLHLAWGGQSRCTSTAEELHALLDRLEARCDEVVMVGDAFDLSRPRRLRDWPGELEAMRREWPELMARLEGMRRVIGNHDRALCAMGVPQEWSVVACGERLLAIHGHQWDVWLKKVWGLEEGANFVAGWLERWGVSEVARWMGEVPLKLDALARGGASRDEGEVALARAERGALREAERGWDVVVYGHTHGLGVRVERGRVLVNTGSHAHGHRDAAVVDLREGWVLCERDGEVVSGAMREEGEWHQGEEAVSRWGGEWERGRIHLPV